MQARNLLDFIQTFPGALPDETCSDMIIQFEGAAKTTTKIEGFREFYEVPVNELGKSSFITLESPVKKPPFTDVLLQAMRRNINAYQLHAGITPSDWPREVGMEKMRMKKYPKGEGQFGRHVDVGDYASARRFMVFFIYLNTVAEGGETLFYGANGEVIHSVKPVRGTLLMFPPLWLFPHAGAMPLTDDKYIAGGYLHYV